MTKVRRSARVLCVDPSGAVLLWHHEWHGRVAPARWLSVGGGIEAGESERDAAVRELFEETGQRVEPDALVGPVRHVRYTTPPGHVWDAFDMTHFVWRCERFTPQTSGWEPSEHDDIREHRWWTLEELRASAESFDLEDVAGTLALLTGETPRPGEPVRVRAAKWDGSPHWHYDGVVVRADDRGVWVKVDGSRTTFSRPGIEAFVGDTLKLTLVPHRPAQLEHGVWALSHWYATGNVALYIDIALPPTLIRREEGWVLEYVDLDLDVIRSREGQARLDDEDEFAEHAAKFGYPVWVLQRATQTAEVLLRAAKAHDEPGRATALNLLAVEQSG